MYALRQICSRQFPEKNSNSIQSDKETQRMKVQRSEDSGIKQDQRAKAFRYDFNQEFDPGSGLTLAACLTHASRARIKGMILRMNFFKDSGGRVSNAWATCPFPEDSQGKL